MAKKHKKINAATPVEEPKMDKRVELLMGTREAEVVAITIKVGDEDVVVNVNTHIPLYVRSQMVEDIASWNFVEDMYVPYMSKFARRLAVLDYYTDLGVGEVMSAADAYRLTQNDALYGAVYEAISDDVDEIFRDADELIEWYKQKLLRSKSDELFDAAKDFVVGLESLLDGVAESTNTTSLPEILSALQHVAKKDETEIARGVLDFQQARAVATKRKDIKN